MPSTQALCPRRKNGTSAPSARPIGASCAQRQVQAPQAVERQQAGGGVGGAAAHAGAAHGTRLSIEMSAPSARAAGCLQRAGGAQAQVVGRQRRRRGRRARSWPSSRALEVQRVAPVDQHEHRLQQVVAVGAPADDVQEQVELGRRRQVVERLHGGQGARTRCAGRPGGCGALRVACRRPGADLATGRRCQPGTARGAGRPARRTGRRPGWRRRWRPRSARRPSRSGVSGCRSAARPAPGDQRAWASVLPSGLVRVSSPACGAPRSSNSAEKRLRAASLSTRSDSRPLQAACSRRRHRRAGAPAAGAAGQQRARGAAGRAAPARRRFTG